MGMETAGLEMGMGMGMGMEMEMMGVEMEPGGVTTNN